MNTKLNDRYNHYMCVYVYLSMHKYTVNSLYIRLGIKSYKGLKFKGLLVFCSLSLVFTTFLLPSPTLSCFYSVCLLFCNICELLSSCILHQRRIAHEMLQCLYLCRCSPQVSISRSIYHKNKTPFQFGSA